MDIGALLHLLVWVVVVGAIFYLLLLLIGYVGLPEPFAKVAKVVVAIVAMLVLIHLLLSLTGGMPRLLR